MGHRVSRPSRDSYHGRANGTAVATSLAILLTLASASTETVSASGPSCGCSCFVSQPHINSLPSAHTSNFGTSATATLRAAPASIIIAASVPPPNSRLGRLRQRPRSSTLQQPPGTKRSQGKGKSGSLRASNLQYATATSSSHYAQYCNNNIHEGVESSIWDSLSPKANAMEGERDAVAPGDEAKDTSSVDIVTEEPYTSLMNVKRGRPTSSKRKRARMLRFMDKRLARLHLRSQEQSSKPSSSKSKSSIERRLIYEERKAAWAAKYTSVHTLRKSFGKNKNRLWGDYDPTSTRRLYHTLLPRALLELRGLRDGLLSNKEDKEGEVDGKARRRDRKNQRNTQSNAGSGDDDDSYLQQELKSLAPLAYQARLAAKKYARERSRLPGRIGSMLYDGYRSWRRYGKWKSTGMTWEQIWSKYEDQVLREAMDELEDAAAETATQLLSSRGYIKEDLDNEELTARICLRILERSVVTNDAIDKLFLETLAEKDEESVNAAEESRVRRRRRQERYRRRKLQIQAELQAIEEKFDSDIRELLKFSNLTTKQGDERRSKRKRGAFFWKKESSDDSSDIEVDAVPPSSLESAVGNVDTTAAAVSRGGGGEPAVAATESDNLAATMLSMTDAVPPSEVDGRATVTASESDKKDSSPLRKLAVHEVIALRILATTKQRITSLQSLPQLGGTTAETKSESEHECTPDSDGH